MPYPSKDMASPSNQVNVKLSEIEQEIEQSKIEIQQQDETLLQAADVKEEEGDAAEEEEHFLVKLKKWICDEDFDELTAYEFNCKVKDFNLAGNELFRLLVNDGFCSPRRAVDILVTLDDLSGRCGILSGALWHFKYDNYPTTKLVDAKRRKRLLDLMKDEDNFIYNKLMCVLNRS
jgi:hypothetical protein